MSGLSRWSATRSISSGSRSNIAGTSGVKLAGASHSRAIPSRMLPPASASSVRHSGHKPQIAAAGSPAFWSVLGALPHAVNQRMIGVGEKNGGALIMKSFRLAIPWLVLFIIAVSGPLRAEQLAARQYLPAGSVDIKALIEPPPALDSAAFGEQMAIVLWLQRTRTPAQVAFVQQALDLERLPASESRASRCRRHRAEADARRHHRRGPGRLRCAQG